MKKLLTLFAFALLAFSANAQNEIDGIYYKLNSSAKTAEVTKHPTKYTGSVSIPSTVSYGGYSYQVTSIGNEAFRDCSSMTSVTIPNSVTSIGSSAFNGCSGLTSVTIPNSVRSIREAVLRDCYGLTSINVDSENPYYDSRNDCNAIIETSSNTLISGCRNTIIPNSVTSIGNYAFEGCSSLTSIDIPNSVTSIGGSAFAGCSGLTTVTIPSSVTKIGSSAFFSCPGLVYVTINSNAILNCSFEYDGYDIEYLSMAELFNNEINFIIGDDVTSIGNEAFYDYDNLKSITIPSSVTSIGGSAFRGCTRLTSITIPNSVTTIGSSAFYKCYGLTSVTIPNSVTSIGGYAFYGCSGLTSIDIPNSVTRIGNYAFSGCTSLPIEGDFRYADTYLVEVVDKNKTSYQIKEGTRFIGDNAFSGCTSLMSYTIPTSVTSIGNGAFSSCSNMQSVVIPPSLTYIGYNAFKGCNSLNKVNISDIVAWLKIEYGYETDYNQYYDDEYIYDYHYSIESNPLFYAHNLYLNDVLLKDIIIPNNINSIGRSAFSGCTCLTTVSIPNSVTNIGNAAFYGCSELISITIPNSVKIIGNKAFYGCSKLTSINIPNSVTNIGIYAFWDCSSLASVTINSNESLNNEYEDNTGYYGISMSGIFNSAANFKLGDNVTEIKDNAFYDYTNLLSVTIPNSVTRIGNSAFYGCSGLTSISIPNSVTSIGNRAFDGCSNLTSVIVENASPLPIAESTFTNRKNATLIVPIGAKNVYSKANYWKDFKNIVEFENSIINFADTKVKAICVEHWDLNGDGELSKAEAAAVHDLYIRNNDEEIRPFEGVDITTFNELQYFVGLTSILGRSFSGCYSLSSISIPNSVVEIEEGAFSGCNKLTSITIPSSVEYIEYGAFSDCTSLTSIKVDSSNLNYDSRDNCNAIIETVSNTLIVGCKNTIIPNSVTSIGYYAFKGCSSLTSITIPNSVTSIGEDAFDGCSSLPVEGGIRYADTFLVEVVDKGKTTYQIKEATRFIGNRAFQNESNMASVIIPATIIKLYSDAFSGCTNLTSVTINSNAILSETRTQNTSLAKVFGNKVTDFIIGDGVTTIGDHAFNDSKSITSITFPNSVTTIGKNAFSNCERLRKIISLNTTAPTIYSTTFPNRTNQYLYVPKNCKSVYFNADYWWEFKEIIVLPADIITFADSNTKSLCVGKWDTNGDGELSESEAAAVTSLGTTFKKSQISSFNELQYFTGLTSISDGAFSKSAVGTITLPENITSIGKEAFLDCKSLTSINIPAKVQTFGQNALSGCTTMTTITVDEGNTAFCSVDGVLFSKDKNTLIQFPAAKATAYTVPEGTKTIGRDAFYVSKLNTVTLPSTLEELGYDAFGYSTLLEALEIPEGVATIGDYIFDNCSNLKVLHIPSTVTTIGERMCNGCNTIEEVYSDILEPFDIVSNNFTTGVYANATLNVPFGTRNAYAAKNGWKEFANIQETPLIITFADAKAKELCISKWDTNGDGELSTAEAAAVTSLGTTFKKSQIASFDELQYFTGLTSISNSAFSGSTIKTITLPENITSLGNDAFLDCKSLTSINIPSKVRTIGQNALSGCTAMTTITVDGDNTVFCDVDGVLFSKDKATLVQFPAAKATSYDVPEGTKTIGRDAFYVSKLKTVALPTTLEELGYDVFGYSTSLTELSIPEGVTTISDYILDHCTALKALHIPSTITSIGEHMSNGCNALTDVYCEMTTPIAIAKNNFTTTAYNNATLHVPAFAVDAYRDTEGWKYFQNIVGDMASNILLADALTINVGKTENLMVNLSNSTEIDGVQFDLRLPEGMTIATKGNGVFDVATTDRSNKLTANCTKKGEGWYRFMLFSIDRSVIEPGEGAIMTLMVECPADATPGDHEASFTGISLSCYAGDVSINHNSDDFTTTVTVIDVSNIPGDVNGDFEVNVSDVMMIVASILDKPSENFIFANADVDKNGSLNVTDVMNVVAIILGNPSPKAPALSITAASDLLRACPNTGGCKIHTTFDAQGFTAMQMTVTLPDGCRLESTSLAGEASRTHKVMAERVDENRYNVVVFSMTGATLKADAPLLDLDISGRDGMVVVENIQCTDIAFDTFLSNDTNTVITGIAAITSEEDSISPVFNTSGQRINKPQRGINVYNGKKVIMNK